MTLCGHPGATALKVFVFPSPIKIFWIHPDPPLVLIALSEVKSYAVFTNKLCSVDADYKQCTMLTQFRLTQST